MFTVHAILNIACTVNTLVHNRTSVCYLMFLAPPNFAQPPSGCLVSLCSTCSNASTSTQHSLLLFYEPPGSVYVQQSPSDPSDTSDHWLIPSQPPSEARDPPGSSTSTIRLLAFTCRPTCLPFFGHVDKSRPLCVGTSRLSSSDCICLSGDLPELFRGPEALRDPPAPPGAARLRVLAMSSGRTRSSFVSNMLACSRGPRTPSEGPEDLPEFPTPLPRLHFIVYGLGVCTSELRWSLRGYLHDSSALPCPDGHEPSWVALQKTRPSTQVARHVTLG